MPLLLAACMPVAYPANIMAQADHGKGLADDGFWYVA